MHLCLRLILPLSDSMSLNMSSRKRVLRNKTKQTVSLNARNSWQREGQAREREREDNQQKERMYSAKGSRIETKDEKAKSGRKCFLQIRKPAKINKSTNQGAKDEKTRINEKSVICRS
jgi:hypothetical protein